MDCVDLPRNDVTKTSAGQLLADALEDVRNELAETRTASA